MRWLWLFLVFPGVLGFNVSGVVPNTTSGVVNAVFNITNPYNVSKRVEVYSYILYKGKSLSGGWKSNSELLVIKPFQTITLSLNNTVFRDVNDTALFRLRVRDVDSNKRFDYDYFIRVVGSHSSDKSGGEWVSWVGLGSIGLASLYLLVKRV